MFLAIYGIICGNEGGFKVLTYSEKEKLKLEINKTLSIMDNDSIQKFLFDSIAHKSGFDEGLSCGPLYLFATEDMRTYYKEFDHPETFLTIGASGDQLLNAILLGAKRIDVFDSNPLSKRGCALKIEAFKSLTKKDFMKYYRRFSAGIFNRFSSNLSEQDSIFWNSLYDIKDGEDIARDLFVYKRLEPELIKKINPYLDDENYEKLKSMIDGVEINYIDAPLYSLPSFLGNRLYDGITLSNIYEYLVFGENVNEKEVNVFYEFIMGEIYSRLTKGGKAMIAYLYAFNDDIKAYVDKLFEEHPDKFLPSGAIRFEDMAFYLQGLTSQNRSYSLLYDRFKDENIEKIQTEHVEYGQSIDMSHDVAMLLKK